MQVRFCFYFQVSIKQATGLPPSLSHFVFCQYQMWGQEEAEVVAPVVNNDYPSHPTAQGESISFKVNNRSHCSALRRYIYSTTKLFNKEKLMLLTHQE